MIAKPKPRITGGTQKVRAHTGRLAPNLKHRRTDKHHPHTHTRINIHTNITIRRTVHAH